MKVPFGRHRGLEIHELPDDYLSWLASLTTYTVSGLSETRKQNLRDAIAAELQRRLDAAPEMLPVVLEAEAAQHGDVVTLH